jgi:hypothetical protein
MKNEITPDYRALCAELIDALHEQTSLYEGHESELVARARTLLAAPEAVGVADEELLGLDELEALWNAQADRFNEWTELGIDEIIAFAQQQALSRFGTAHPAPVPVGEGLPGVEDCDAEGRCWFLFLLSNDPTWTLEHHNAALCSGRSHWLPHWALPLPGDQPRKGG